jgi:hypothetical protein
MIPQKEATPNGEKKFIEFEKILIGLYHLL